jgi:regulatory protein
MPVITTIKPQKGKGRVNVYLDGKFGFGIDYENYVRLKLQVEQELSEEEIEEIKAKANFQKILNNLLDFASRRPRSEKEYTLWMKRKNVPEDFHISLFSRLKEFNLLDDEAFAKWWIDQRLSFQKKSKRFIIQELRFKGINKEIINKVLGEAEVDEAKVARELLKQKEYKWKSLKGTDKKKKMSEFLIRKGFSWDIIKQVVGELH